MAKSVNLSLPLNRVEGDLHLRVALTDGQVTAAYCSGTMYRGFEQLLKGRAPLDALVITPRICGICSTAHLLAAARALDQLTGAEVPPDAIRVRNVALLVENIQNDLRHAFLMFSPDFANERYREQALYEEAVHRYAPYVGASAVAAVSETKRILEVVGILGGQWPHSHFMVPGGVASLIANDDLARCRVLLYRFRQWYEQRVLGCPIERWLEVGSLADLDRWLAESPEHRGSDLGFYLEYARALGLDRLGRGHGNFLCYGGFDLMDGSRVRALAAGRSLLPAGFAQGVAVQPFDAQAVTEDTAYSWFRDAGGPQHPSVGTTEPYATGNEGSRYSWAKAPRYAGLPAETGPLANLVVAGRPLYVDLVRRQGPSVFSRQLARLTRTAELLSAVDGWLSELTGGADLYRAPAGVPDGQAAGLIEAARGSLGHWLTVDGGVIDSYQVVTPTAWHASPRDHTGCRGTTEEALMGTPVAEPDNPVELGHVVRSFDHCLVCTVHLLRRGRPDLRWQVR